MANSVGSAVDGSMVVFEDLTQVCFAKEEGILEFRFVEAYDEIVPQIVNSRRRAIYRRLVSPDVIRFSPDNKLLVNKIKQLAEGINLYQIPMSYDPESNYYEILARDSNIFFAAIRLLQVDDPKMVVPAKQFHDTLSALLSHHHVTPTEVEDLNSKIKTSSTLAEYKEETEIQRNVSRAISLAYYYRSKKDPYQDSAIGAIGWLSKAKEYLGDRNLSKLIDLDEFLMKFKEIDSITIFRSRMEEIAEAAARCPSIKELNFSPFTDYNYDTAVRIGKFIEKTTSVEKVDLQANWAFDIRRLDAKTLTPIADALRTNASVQSLNLANTRIGDKGVLKLVQAIDSNPESKITDLNLFSCGMTERSAIELYKLIKKKEQIKWVNIENFDISKVVQQQFEEILKKRNSK